MATVGSTWVMTMYGMIIFLARGESAMTTASPIPARTPNANPSRISVSVISVFESQLTLEVRKTWRIWVGGGRRKLWMMEAWEMTGHASGAIASEGATGLSRWMVVQMFFRIRWTF